MVQGAAPVGQGRHRAKQQQSYTVERTGEKNTGHKETRAADFLVARDKVQGKEIVEVKDIEGLIDVEQFGAYADALRDDNVRTQMGAERLRYVFTKSEGAVASLEFLANSYDKANLAGRLTIEVYLPDGSVKSARNEQQAMQLLNELKGH